MSAIKEIYDLITDLRDKIEDRKIIAELLQIQSYVDSLHSDWLMAQERALDYKTQISNLNEQIIQIKQEIRAIEEAHRKEIRDIKMLHNAEMAGSNDGHTMAMNDLIEKHAKEVKSLKEETG